MGFEPMTAAHHAIATIRREEHFDRMLSEKGDRNRRQREILQRVNGCSEMQGNGTLH